MDTAPRYIGISPAGVEWIYYGNDEGEYQMMVEAFKALTK